MCGCEVNALMGRALDGDTTLWETGGFQKALYQHVDTVT